MTFQLGGYLLLWALLVNSGCNAPQSTPKIAPQVDEKPAQQASEAAPELMPKGLFDQDPKGAAAWLRLTEDGRYRMARRDDFQIPEAVMKEHLNDPFFTNKFAYVGGDFDRDGHLMDRAFIIVDTTTTRKSRFGLVVFNAPADERSLPSVHWVFKAHDLSKSVLSAATDVLYVTEYHEDDTQDVCHVRWDKKREEYSCEKSRRRNQIGVRPAICDSTTVISGHRHNLQRRRR
jgi:hypothetical protein